jgi:hypothetical protein
MTPVAPTLAAFATGPVPHDAALRAIAVRHISDAIGCGLAAVGTGAGGEATQVARGGRRSWKRIRAGPPGAADRPSPPPGVR